MLRGESLEHRVGVLRVPHLQRPVGLVRPGSVEDEVTARPFERHEAGELVTELPQVLVAPGVKEVVSVEQIQGWLGHQFLCLARCRFASYNSNAAATLTLSDSTFPFIGIETASDTFL